MLEEVVRCLIILYLCKIIALKLYSAHSRLELLRKHEQRNEDDGG